MELGDADLRQVPQQRGLPLVVLNGLHLLDVDLDQILPGLGVLGQALHLLAQIFALRRHGVGLGAPGEGQLHRLQVGLVEALNLLDQLQPSLVRLGVLVEDLV